MSLKALAASLKAGGYASASAYLATYKVEAERQGFAWPPALQRAIKDFSRSCDRGKGGPKRARPLDFAALGDLPWPPEPWVSDGPVNPRAAMIVGCWWLTREVELANAQMSHVEVTVAASGPKRGTPIAKWFLPASKTDTAALGVARSHRCTCTPGSPSPSCPSHVMLAHLHHLKRAFPEHWVDDRPRAGFPLFPTASGDPVSKTAMVATIQHAAGLQGIPLRAPDWSEQVSGHSLRVTGAQGLAQLGWHLWAVQLIGRWGSEVVRQYLRDAPLLSPAPQHAAQDLDSIVASVVAKLSSTSEADTQQAVAAALGFDKATEEEKGHLTELVACESSRSASEGYPVMNSTSGVVHRLVGIPPVCKIYCGWNHTDSPHAHLPADTALPRFWWQLCGRCYPSERLSAKGGISGL